MFHVGRLLVSAALSGAEAECEQADMQYLQSACGDYFILLFYYLFNV